MGPLIGMTEERLQQVIAAAVTMALDAKTPPQENQINKQEAMKLAGYSDNNAFRKFCVENNIAPVAVRARRNYYLPSQILNPRRTKGHATK